MTKMRVEINDELLGEAMSFLPEMSKSEIVTLALQRLIEVKRVTPSKSSGIDHDLARHEGHS